MLQDDYILRQIREMVRAVMKMLFQVNASELTPEVIEVSDVLKSTSSGNGHASASYDVPAPVKKDYSDRTYNVCGIILVVLAVVLVLLGLLLLLAVPVGGVAAILLGVGCFAIGRKYRKIVKERSEK